MTKREIWASGQKKKSKQRDNRCIKNWPLSLLILDTKKFNAKRSKRFYYA